MLSNLLSGTNVFLCYSEDVNRARRIVFSTEERIEIYEHFPKVICLDLTYNSNRGK